LSSQFAETPVTSSSIGWDLLSYFNQKTEQIKSQMTAAVAAGVTVQQVDTIANSLLNALMDMQVSVTGTTLNTDKNLDTSRANRPEVSIKPARRENKSTAQIVGEAYLLAEQQKQLGVRIANLEKDFKQAKTEPRKLSPSYYAPGLG
jgi:Tfp pilus assembly PilM family ATPase